MDLDHVIVVFLACVAVVHQWIIAHSILFDDVPTLREKKLL
jgi:hypothetical protein